MAKFETHGGTIFTNESTSPGYVWFSCAEYGLPDNTMGKIGFHSRYRPLCDNYQAKEEGLVSDDLKALVSAHYAEERAAEDEARRVRAEREWDKIRAMTPAQATTERMGDRARREHDPNCPAYYGGSGCECGG